MRVENRHKTAAPGLSLRKGAIRGLRYALEQVPHDPPQTRGRHRDTGRVTNRAVRRRPASRRRLSRYRKRTVDLAGTRYTMCCCFRTHRRLSPGHLEEPQGENYGILLLATDAARRPGLNVMLYGDRLFQQYVVDSCAKMEQQRLNYLNYQNSL